MLRVSRFLIFPLAFGLFGADALAQTPGPPQALMAVVNADQTVTLSWSPPTTGGLPTGYIVEIGTSTGASDLVNEQIGNVTTHRSVVLSAGIRYARVRALNGAGISAPSNEVSFTIVCVTPTSGAQNLSWRPLAGNQVQLAWTSVADLTWTVEVGSAPGLADVFVGQPPFQLKRTITITLAPGTYYTRVKGRNSCGTDAPVSAELTIVSGEPTGTSLVRINEFDGFVELKNVATAAVDVGGWRLVTAAGFDKRVSLAAQLPTGTLIGPGCTYLLATTSTVEGVTVDQLMAVSGRSYALVNTSGRILDSAAYRDFNASNPTTPFGEGALLPNLLSGSYARVNDQDTNDNPTDFVRLSTPTPQNSSGCGQTTPGAPTNLMVSVSGAMITLSWIAPTTGSAPTGYVVQIGTMSGAANVLNQQIGNVTTFQTTVLAAGTYFARVRAINSAGASGFSNEVTIVVTTSGAPAPPTNLMAAVNGNTVTLSWSPPAAGPAPTQYLLEAGTSPGSSNAALFTLGISPTAVMFAGVPNGTFYVRLRAVNASGQSPPSNEVTVVVCGVGCAPAPGPVTNLTFQVNGNTVLLTWNAPTTGGTPTGYVIEAGTAPGLTNIGQFPTGSTATFVIVGNVPPNTYFVRVRAAAGNALGPPSNEVVIVVP